MNTLIEKWVYFIKNAENLEIIPDNTEDKGLQEAYKDAEKHSWEREELIAYDNAAIAVQDQKGQITIAAKKAKIEGKREGKVEVVKKCFANNMPLESIPDITDFTIAELEEILELQ